MTETADIVVVGGGCIGASIALHLAERGADKVLLLEQKNLANGASGKGAGIISIAWIMSPVYTAPLVLVATATSSVQSLAIC